MLNFQTFMDLDSFGRLYNWYAVDNSSGRYICPEGWHVPTKDEYTVLIAFLGGTSVAGGKLKETGTEYWNSPNTVSDNASGFNARGSGFRTSMSGNYSGRKYFSYSWTNSSLNNINAYFQELRYSTAGNVSNSASKKYGFSVRCLED